MTIYAKDVSILLNRWDLLFSSDYSYCYPTFQCTCIIEWMLRLLTQATTFYLRPLAFMVVKCFDITHIMQVKWLARQCVLVKNEDMVVGWF